MKASRLIDYLGHMEQAAADALGSSRYTHRCPAQQAACSRTLPQRVNLDRPCSQRCQIDCRNSAGSREGM